MLLKIKHLVKNSKLLYKLYYHGGSAMLRAIGLFIKTDPNLVLFASYGGRKYDDSPRVVYEYLLKHPICPDHKYIWAFANPEDFPEVKNKVQIDTPAYYLTALRAGYWITNTSIARGMDFRKKDTKSYYFAHALTAMKRIGVDVLDDKNVFVSEAREKFDAVFIEGKHEIPILSKVWDLEASVFYTTGLPRNDDLVGTTEQEKNYLRQKLGIPEGKQVILYAPTFRDNVKNAEGRLVQEIPMNLEKWQHVLGEKYMLLINVHYAVARLFENLPENGFAVNVSGYPRLNDLLKVADILISDYSSIVFDYSILERPILGYCYDYDEYMAMRGSYLDIQNFYYCGAIRNEEALLDAIVNLDYEASCCFTREKIRDRHLASYGNAAEKAVKVIFGVQSKRCQERK